MLARSPEAGRACDSIKPRPAPHRARKTRRVLQDCGRRSSNCARSAPADAAGRTAIRGFESSGAFFLSTSPQFPQPPPELHHLCALRAFAARASLRIERGRAEKGTGQKKGPGRKGFVPQSEPRRAGRANHLHRFQGMFRRPNPCHCGRSAAFHRQMAGVAQSDAVNDSKIQDIVVFC